LSHLRTATGFVDTFTDLPSRYSFSFSYVTLLVVVRWSSRLPRWCCIRVQHTCSTRESGSGDRGRNVHGLAAAHLPTQPYHDMQGTAQIRLRHGTRAKEQGRTPGSLTTSTGAAVDSASMLLRCFNSHVLSSLLELVFQHHGTWGSYASKPEGPTQQVWGVSPRCKAACAVSPDTTRRIRHGVSSFARCAHTRTAVAHRGYAGHHERVRRPQGWLSAVRSTPTSVSCSLAPSIGVCPPWYRNVQ